MPLYRVPDVVAEVLVDMLKNDQRECPDVVTLEERSLLPKLQKFVGSSSSYMTLTTPEYNALRNLLSNRLLREY
jgi:hypothetical protein